VEEERLSILKMVEEGRVTAEEGLKLLNALDPPRRGEMRLRARRLRVRVSELGSGRTRAEVNIPIELAELGLKLAARLLNRGVIRVGRRAVDPEELAQAVRHGELGRVLGYTDDDENARVEVFLE